MRSKRLTISAVREQICEIQNLLVHLARYQWLQLLCVGAHADKAKTAALAAQLIDAASLLREFQFRHFQQRTNVLAWHSQLAPSFCHVIKSGEVDRTALDRVCSTLCWNLVKTIEALHENSQKFAIFSHCTAILDQILPIIPRTSDTSLVFELAPCDWDQTNAKGITKAESGPQHGVLDPVFRRTYSLLDSQDPRFSNSLHDVVPRFWILSAREAMACDSCALSAVEYDGLPLEFYRDMGKQAWDEARHAVMFLDLAKDLMRDLTGSLPAVDPLFQMIARFQAGEARLPVPLEGNLYEAMWNADLTERLVLMQIDTEGRAPAMIGERIKSEICHDFPCIRWALEIDRCDEIAHARIGARWLKHIVPPKEARLKAIEAARLLRNVFVVASISHYHEASFPELLSLFTEGRSLSLKPYSYVEESAPAF